AGLALNFLAIPLMAVAQLAGMALVPIALAAPPIALGIGWIAHLGAAGLVASAELGRFVPVLVLRVRAPGWWPPLAHFVSLLAWWFLWRHRAEVSGSAESPRLRVCRRTAVPVALAAAIWIAFDPWTLVASRGDGRLHVTFIDVGQGDAALVRFPHGAAMLIDAGGSVSPSYDVGERVVGPVAREAGLHTAGTIVVAHGAVDPARGGRGRSGGQRP